MIQKPAMDCSCLHSLTPTAISVDKINTIQPTRVYIPLHTTGMLSSPNVLSLGIYFPKKRSPQPMQREETVFFECGFSVMNHAFAEKKIAR